MFAACWIIRFIQFELRQYYGAHLVYCAQFIRCYEDTTSRKHIQSIHLCRSFAGVLYAQVLINNEINCM